MKDEIIDLLIETITHLTDRPDILAIVGSIGDTLTDEEAVNELRFWCHIEQTASDFNDN